MYITILACVLTDCGGADQLAQEQDEVGHVVQHNHPATVTISVTVVLVTTINISVTFSVIVVVVTIISISVAIGEIMVVVTIISISVAISVLVVVVTIISLSVTISVTVVVVNRHPRTLSSTS